MFDFIKKLTKKLRLLFIKQNPIKKDNLHTNSYTKEKKSQVLISKSKYLEVCIFNLLNSISINVFKKILVDLQIPRLNNKSTQVDLVFINNTGIYVIEAKNLSCVIFGNNKENYWLKKYANGDKHKFCNPIKKNNTNIQEIKEVLGTYDDSFFTSLIVFGDSCRVKYNDNLDDLEFSTKIVNLINLKQILNSMFTSKDPVLSDSEIFNIYNTLSRYTIQSKEKKIKHIEYVKNVNKV